jgi:hypothetical protein
LGVAIGGLAWSGWVRKKADNFFSMVMRSGVVMNDFESCDDIRYAVQVILKRLSVKRDSVLEEAMQAPIVGGDKNDIRYRLGVAYGLNEAVKAFEGVIGNVD